MKKEEKGKNKNYVAHLDILEKRCTLDRKQLRESDMAKGICLHK